MASKNHVPVDFCSLGMFIIDEIHPPPAAPVQVPQFNIIGGAGTYSAIGARLCSPLSLSRSVGWVVDAGTDFPSELRSIIASWSTGVLIRERPALTTRGWNGYTTPTHRAFKYTTLKLRLTPSDLSISLLASKSFHLICSPTRCIDQCEALHTLRKSLDSSLPQPIIIWEPVPDLCVAAELESTLTALAHVDIVSPNHEELASLFSSPPTAHEPEIDKDLVESQAARLVEKSNGRRDLAVVIRCAASGVYVLSRSRRISRWLPAYHTSASKVIDPTGGGNGFLGGLAVGLVRTGGDLVDAVRWGNVSASFCIEQVGVPVLRCEEASEGVSGGETWNGEDVMGRLEEYRKLTP